MNEPIIQNKALTEVQKQLAQQLITSLDPEQQQWLGGYLSGLNEANSHFLNLLRLTNGNGKSQELKISEESDNLIVLYGSRSGNSRKVAQKAADYAASIGIAARLIDMNEYNIKNLKKEKNILIIVSTHGEGEPPSAAQQLHTYVLSEKAPQLSNVNYAVLGLGDSSYKYFCQTGIDFDDGLKKLGANQLAPHTGVDLDFEESSIKWIENVVPLFKTLAKNVDPVLKKPIREAEEGGTKYSRSNPFNAPVIDKIKLNGRGSTKETLHIELSLEGSGFNYKPGDSLGVYSYNNPEYVDQLIQKLKFSPDEPVVVNNKEQTLRNALIHSFELTILTPLVIEKYAKLTVNERLDALNADKSYVSKYTHGRDIIDLLNEYPAPISVNEFLSVLRKLPPRLYSIASSQNEVEDEVHLTVSTVRYNYGGRQKEGVCSTFLSDRIHDNEYVKVYIDTNDNFRLPDDNKTPIIMIGPGTGVAPFRAFMQERNYSGQKSKNWLFFGDRNFKTDFLYQAEWLKYKKSGLLTRLDVAFSRDQGEKIYVQHRMLEKSKEIFRWIKDGAILYICGDKTSMAKDVKKTLHSILSKQGNLSSEKATEYINILKKDRRLQEDIY